MVPVTIREILDYEIMASWWTQFISWEWAQNIVAKYFAWKVQRKYGRYVKFVEMRQRLKQETR